MSKVIKNSFDESNNHVEVIFQTGKPVADFELNEVGQIMRVQNARTAEESLYRVYSGEDYSPGSNDDGFKPTPGGANTVALAAGTLVIKGTRIVVAAQSVVLPVAAATMAIYVCLVETEIVDPAALATLGETTRRRKITATVLVSPTGVGDVPASSPLPLWLGGTVYETICTVTRRAADTSVLTGDIVDFRRLLPTSVLTQVTRQTDFKVRAVKARQFESDPAGFSAGFKPITFVANAGQIVGPPGDVDKVAFYSSEGPDGPDTGLGLGDRFLSVKFRLASGDTPAHYWTSLGGEALGAFGADSGPTYVHDEYTEGNPVVKLLPLTSTDNGEIRTFEARPTVYNALIPGSGVSSVVKTLNARWAVTVGDGDNSKGDFTGQDALQEALTYFRTVVYPSTGLSVCHIKLKTGLHIFTPPTGITVPDGVALIIEGESSATCSIICGGSGADTIGITVQAGGYLCLKSLSMKMESATHASARSIETSGTVFLEDCDIQGNVTTFDVTANTLGLQTPPGLRATRCRFRPASYTGDLSPVFPCIRVLQVTTPLGTGVASQVEGLFESCTFEARTQSSVVHFTSTTTTPNTVGRYTFRNCAFDVSDSPLTSSNAGVVTATVDDAFAGSTRVSCLTFDGCWVVRHTDVTKSIVLDLRASNDSDSAVGIVFDEIIMKNCDWRVPEEFGRAESSWHIGENSVDSDLGVSTAVRFSIKRLVIDNVLFGYVPNGVTTPGYNTYGLTRGTLGSTYPAALTLHAEDLVLRDVKFDNPNVRSSVPEVLIAGAGNLTIDGLSIVLDLDGNIASGVVPKSRVMIMGVKGTPATPNGRTRYTRKVRGLDVMARSLTGQCATEGMVSVVPAGNLSITESSIRGYEGDVAILMDPTSNLTLGYTAWSFSGFSCSHSDIINVNIGLMVPLPTSGDIDVIRNTTLHAVRFIDVRELFYVHEAAPAGNTAYHTAYVGFRVSECSLVRDGLLGTPFGNCKFNFRVGRLPPSDAEVPESLTMRDNDFTRSCQGYVGARATLTPVGIYWSAKGNTVDSFYVDVYTVTANGRTHGVNTGMTALTGGETFVDGADMIHNRAKFRYIP